MKKMKFIVIIILTFLSSCGKDYLDIVPDNVATLDDVFTNRASAKRQLATCYSYLLVNGDRNSDPSVLSGDELAYPPGFDNTAPVRISKGYQDPNFAYFDKWTGTTSYYVAIRNCNLFLSRINEIQDIQEFEREHWIAEVKFLKAYYNFLLVRMYGPIIINDTNDPIASNAGDIIKDRSKIDVVFPYIIGLMDEAIETLNGTIPSTDYGRISKAIAAAIKARVAITYASPLFNGNAIYTQFKNENGESYFPLTYDNSKWEKAAEACKEAIDICSENGFRLYQKEDYNLKAPQADITILKAGLRGRITDRDGLETIWAMPVSSFNSAQQESYPRLFLFQGGGSIASRRAPTLRVAEQYYSNNGVPIEEDFTYDYENRYKLRTATEVDKYFIQPNETTANLHFGREPRFYADLGFDRGTWFGNEKDGTDEAWYLNQRTDEYGAPVGQFTYSATGYITKKLVNITTFLSPSLSFSLSAYAFPIIRLSDLYLYYAEALNESKGPTEPGVYESVDLIRKRAGLNGVVESWADFSIRPDRPSTKNGMRDIIQKERLIEMAFEGNRFWDLRRWLLAKEYLNRPIKGWNVLGNSKDDPNVYYQLKVLNTDKFSRFEEKDYLWPIPSAEIINIPSLIQNPGWD